MVLGPGPLPRVGNASPQVLTTPVVSVRRGKDRRAVQQNALHGIRLVFGVFGLIIMTTRFLSRSLLPSADQADLQTINNRLCVAEFRHARCSQKWPGSYSLYLCLLTNLAAALNRCYYPNSKEAVDDYPCDTEAEYSSCCGAGSMCFSNRSCKGPGRTMIRGSCTDQAWGSLDYPLYCYLRRCAHVAISME
jgi:hypothetical protein